MNKQDGVYPRTASHLESQYSFGSRFAQALGIATDARQAAVALEDTVGQALAEQYTTLLRDSRQIVLGALAGCARDEDLQQLQQTVQSRLAILADEIQMRFSSASQRITDVDDTLQQELTQLRKYIRFTGADGIVIGAGDNAVTLTLDTDGIVFSKNGVSFGRWDGNDFYTGNIIVGVNQRAQLGSFAFIPRSDGSMMFSKVKESQEE